MLQPRRELDLASKAIRVQSGGEIGRKNLDNHLSSELGLRRHEHTRHSSTAELAVDSICGAECFLQLTLKIGRQARLLGLECRIMD